MTGTVRIAGGGYEAYILPRAGANCLRLVHIPTGAEILRCPRNEKAFSETPELYGIPVLFPPNRISDGTFRYAGRTYTFPVNEPERMNHIHGMLMTCPFECVHSSDHEACFQYRADERRPYGTFPHAFSVTIRCSVGAEGLKQTVHVTNESDSSMPLMLGFHTTLNVPFLPHGQRETCEVRVDAVNRYFTDGRKLPTGEKEDASAFRKGIPAAGTPVSALLSLADKEAKAYLTDTAAGMRVCCRFGTGWHYAMLFSGDGKSGFFCIEPQTCMTNAPNTGLPDAQSGFTALSPGETRILSFVLSLEKTP